MIFGINMELQTGENASAVTVKAEDSLSLVYPMPVEFVGPVPGFDWLTQIVVRLPDNLPAGQTVLVSSTLRGKTTNKVRVRIQ